MAKPETGAQMMSALLDAVHDRLKAGDYSSLGAMALQIETAEAMLSGCPADELIRLRAKADRNARALLATRRGIRAAQRRVAEVLSAARGLVTYDRQGQRVEQAEACHLPRRF